MRKRETIDWIGGPSSPADEHGPAHSVVSLGAIDPTVMMGTLEELLTGRPFLEQILKAPGRKPVAIRDEGERLVIPLGPRMDQALAAASDDRLREVAIPWSRTDEFRGRGDPMVLAEGLIRRAALARSGRPSNLA